MRLAAALHLATAELRHHPARTLLVVVALALALGSPTFAVVGAARLDAEVRARAAATPLLVAPRGAALEVTFAVLFLRLPRTAVGVPARWAREVHTRRAGRAAPVLLGPTVGGAPLVGTTPDYFDLRGLRVVEGRLPAVPGEVVVGAALAARGIRPGARLRSDALALHDVGGSRPVGLTVVGVLGASGGAEDRAAFTGVPTLRAIEGRLHAHAVGEENGEIEASAAEFLPTDLSAVDPDALHLHGDPEALPVTAVLVAPADARSRDQLLGDLALDAEAVGVIPSDVVAELLGAFTWARDAAVAWLVGIGAATAALAAVVVALSVRLRASELALLARLGAGRRAVATVVGVEVALVTGAALALATLGVVGGLWALDGWLG